MLARAQARLASPRVVMGDYVESRHGRLDAVLREKGIANEAVDWRAHGRTGRDSRTVTPVNIWKVGVNCFQFCSDRHHRSRRHEEQIASTIWHTIAKQCKLISLRGWLRPRAAFRSNLVCALLILCSAASAGYSTSNRMTFFP
jgi:hypothetical protein